MIDYPILTKMLFQIMMNGVGAIVCAIIGITHYKRNGRGIATRIVPSIIESKQ